MDDLKNKIKEAKSAGYQDDEIVKYLASMPDLTQSITSAYENQYTPSEILKLQDKLLQFLLIQILLQRIKVFHITL